MGTFTIKMPDVGEGVAEAELVEWNVKVGDPVKEDTVLASVMTDKATVEIPSPVDGTVKWLGGEVGEALAIGSVLVTLEVAGADGISGPDENSAKTVGTAGDTPEAPSEDVAPTLSDPKASEPDAAQERQFPRRQSGADEKPSTPVRDAPRATPTTRSDHFDAVQRPAARRSGERPLASPAVRRRAMEAGVDLRRVSGGGPAGRIRQEDLDAFLKGGAETAGSGRRIADNSVSDIKIAGLRRRIAEKMALATSRIAHITYVEEIDMVALEDLRAVLNRDRRDERPKLTILPFLMCAMVIALRDQPQINALFDDEVGVLHQHGGVHIGIAAQTDAGLMVPVARHCEARDLWGCAAEAARLAAAAKSGHAKRDELSGSTITITSLGALGGIATTPVINHPEVAIVGVNKMEVRPVWDGVRFVPRKRMNLSSSFDHRVIDGYDAAVFVQRIKTLLETPAMIFAEG